MSAISIARLSDILHRNYPTNHRQPSVSQHIFLQSAERNLNSAFILYHTNPEYASLKKTAGKVKELDAELSTAKSECTSTKIEAEIFRADLEKAEAENTNLSAKVKAQEEEIMKLKARLYDLMVAGK